MGYVGADLFPEDVTLPTDAPPLSAAILNVPNEANLDRTRWLFRREAMRAIHFDPMVENAKAHTTHRDGRPAYSLRRQRWYFGVGSVAAAGCAVTEDCGGSFFYAATFNVATGFHCCINNNTASPRYGDGIFVPVKTSLLPWSYVHATDTYTVMAALPSATWGGVIHEPVADTYVIWDIGKIWTTPAAAPGVWTDRSALPGGGIPGIIPIASNGAGVLMCHGKVKGVYTSVDGGVTWVECVTAFGLAAISSIAWDAWRGRFVVVLTDGAGLAETWWSLDGSAWAMLATGIAFPGATANYIFEVRSIGPTLIATHLPSALGLIRLVYSVDGGATWGRAPAPVWGQTDAPVFLATNGSDVVAVNLNTNYKGVSFARGFVPFAF